jgi:hypothetical protein
MMFFGAEVAGDGSFGDAHQLRDGGPGDAKGMELARRTPAVLFLARWRAREVLGDQGRADVELAGDEFVGATFLGQPNHPLTALGDRW